MISFDEALALLLAEARPLGSETVALETAAGRVLAEPARARIAAPRRAVSAMDGYAVREADLAGGPVSLPVVGEALPGQAEVAPLGGGTTVRIFTGAPVPEGADRVVMQEEVAREGAAARFAGPPGESRFVRAAGSDFAEGEVLVPAGRRLGPRDLVAAAAGDLGALVVHRRPRVAILATGDELAAPGSAREDGGLIPESIGVGLAALVAGAGGVVVRRLRLPDRLDLLRDAAREALGEADLLVVVGGASVGERDFGKAMVDGLALLFSRIAIKPGKPVWFGRAEGRLVLGLPGNPTSAMVTARLFLAPLVAGLSGGDLRGALGWREVPLGHAVGAVGPRETFARGVIEEGRVRLLGQQDSGAQRALAVAQVLVRRPAGGGALEAGALVPVIDL